MENHLRTLVPGHLVDPMMEMTMMTMTRMMTEGKIGMIRFLRIKEDGTRDPQKMRGQKRRIGFPAY